MLVTGTRKNRHIVFAADALHGDIVLRSTQLCAVYLCVSIVRLRADGVLLLVSFTLLHNSVGQELERSVVEAKVMLQNTLQIQRFISLCINGCLLCFRTCRCTRCRSFTLSR